MRRSVTREQLYEMIWERAVSKVAPELGISDVALRKRCRALHIPLPDARYWGRFHAGKPLERPPLPSAPAGVPETIQFQPSRRPCSIAADGAAKKLKGEFRAPQLPPRREPSIVATIKALRNSRQDNNGGIKSGGPGVFVVRAHPDLLDRVGAFLDLFVAAAAANGIHFRDGTSGLDLEINGERVGFALSQTIRRSRHRPTVEELRRQERWDSKHASDWDKWRERPSVPFYDFTPTGEMSFEITGWPRPAGVTHKFTDSRIRRIEERLSDILASATAHAAYQEDWRHEQAVRRARVEEEQTRRAREEQERRLEQQRVEFLGRVLSRRGQYLAVNELVLELEQADAGSCDSKFLLWAREHCASLASSLTLAALETEAQSLDAFTQYEA